MIGGNTEAMIQISDDTTTNDIGEQVLAWKDVQSVKGWLDYRSGDSKYNVYSAKIQESTHLFLCDYVPLDASISAENSRMIVNGERYDVVLIDDPMELHKHLEIYLKFTGGQ